MINRSSLVVVAALALAGCKKKTPESAGGDVITTSDGTAVLDATASAAPAESPSQKVERVMGKAVAALSTGDPTVAPDVVKDLKELTGLAPDKAEIPYNIGIAYELMGDDTNARKAYLRATDIDPSLGEAWLNIGAMAEERGEYDRALQSYQAGLRYDPDNEQLVVGVVGALLRQGRYSQAVTEAKQALGRNANNVNVYNNLGLVYLAQGQTDLASFVYQKALNSIEGAGDNAYLHANLGRVHMARDEDYLAQQELERALELDANMVPAMVALAQLHMDDHDWNAAAELLERGRERAPNDADILINLGVCYRGLGRYEEAQALYKQALDLAPEDPTPYLNLAVLQGDYMRAYDAALASIDRYVSAGGSRTDLADQWRSDLTEAKEKYNKDLERRKKRDDREKKRKEEERLAAEHEALMAKKSAAADKAMGKSCPTSGCPEFTACSRDNICVEEGSPGTAIIGGACEADADCTYGTMCGPDATCVAGSSIDAVPVPPGVVPAVPEGSDAELPVTPATDGEGSGSETGAPAGTPDPWGGEQ